jgi:hypothetical protein
VLLVRRPPHLLVEPLIPKQTSEVVVKKSIPSLFYATAIDVASCGDKSFAFVAINGNGRGRDCPMSFGPLLSTF